MKITRLALVLGCVFALSGVAAAVLPPVDPPYTAPAGMWWQLGPELMPDGGFETGTPGGDQPGWNSGFGNVTDAIAYEGNNSLWINNNAQAFLNSGDLTVSVGEYYRFEFHHTAPAADEWNNHRFTLVRNTGGVLPSDKCAELLHDVSGPFGWDSGVGVYTVYEAMNGWWPAYRRQAYSNRNEVFETWEGTIEILPGITEVGGYLQPNFLAYAGSGMYLDGISLKEWQLVPEPATLGLISVGGVLALLRRKR